MLETQTTISLAMAEETPQPYTALRAIIDLMMECEGVTVERVTTIVKAAAVILHQDKDMPAFRDFCCKLLATLHEEDTPEKCMADIQAAILAVLDECLDEVIH